MARRNFDYSHTCPDIDKGIGSAKNDIENRLTSIIESLCPHIAARDVERLAKEWSVDIYNDIEDCFESVRKTNEDMREAAERQINDMIDEADELKDEIKELKYALEQLA